MDSQPGLSLGSSARISSQPSRLCDISFLFLLNHILRGYSNRIPSVPWQLLEEKDNKVKFKLKNDDEEEDEVKQEEEEEEEEEEGEVEDQTINFMGRPLCVKRKWKIEGQACFHSKRLVVDSGVEERRASVQAWENQPLGLADPEIHEIMEKERQRQFRGIELIASENFACRAVMEALGSHLTSKYSEGRPGAMYYAGNHYIDQIELLCCKRALDAFDVDPNKWGVNAQPYPCTSANFAVHAALFLPGDRIMGLDSPSGGNLSHGYCSQSGKKVSPASIFLETLPYEVNPQTCYIDYDNLEDKALDFRPKILICGGSSYTGEWDYERFRPIADKCGAVLMCDIAHISGLVAAKEVASPFDSCDIVTPTSHKSLRGPRRGIIFYRRGTKPRKQGLILNQGYDTNYDFEEKIKFSLYPSLQGGPHNYHISALGMALKQVGTEYKVYMQQVKKNASVLASSLLKRKCRLLTDGTDNHLLLRDLTALGFIDRNYEKVCEACYITLNKCAIYGSVSPGEVRIGTSVRESIEDHGHMKIKGRIVLLLLGLVNVLVFQYFTLVPLFIGIHYSGTPAMTSRGCLEDDFEIIADFHFKAAQITTIVQWEHGKSCEDFLKDLQNNKDIIELKNRVETFASQLGMPGFHFLI